ncbi:hypothetical protein SDC9_182149 [bioreactor metagenome]|uniref:Uncharacterized protein n=1 Tax=bioreactor metagenome TaxID=1076179 RepID=A0A645H6P3_9ZZZZ
MSYISSIFDRTHIQQISEFLLNGVGRCEIDGRSYQERLKEAEQDALKVIKRKYPELSDYDEITQKLFMYIGVVESVYTEIGLRCGMTLGAQMLSEMSRE